MKQAVWSEDYKISSFLLNLRGRAGLYAILNFIQDVGWLHAINMQVKLEKHYGWVFTRQKLEMNQWPKWNEVVTIRTWLRPPSGSFLMRDYEIFLSGKKIGECTSTFSVMDMQTRKLAVIDFGNYGAVFREEGLLTKTPEKILPISETQELAQFEVRNSDIDSNNHVNNTKYAQWILDSIPIENLRTGAELKSYEVNFLAECKTGDVVKVHKGLNDTQFENESVIQFQGLRAADSKPVFTALMRVIASADVR